MANAFVTTQAADASAALAEAHARYTEECGLSECMEVRVPPAASREWLEDLVRRIVYHCDCRGLDVPRCAGVFVAFFHDDRVDCVAASTVLAFAGPHLNVRAGELLARYGTRESHQANQLAAPEAR
jgi:hypothetical protein